MPNKRNNKNYESDEEDEYMEGSDAYEEGNSSDDDETVTVSVETSPSENSEFEESEDEQKSNSTNQKKRQKNSISTDKKEVKRKKVESQPQMHMQLDPATNSAESTKQVPKFDIKFIEVETIKDFVKDKEILSDNIPAFESWTTNEISQILNTALSIVELTAVKIKSVLQRKSDDAEEEENPNLYFQFLNPDTYQQKPKIEVQKTMWRFRHAFSNQERYQMVEEMLRYLAGLLGGKNAAIKKHEGLILGLSRQFCCALPQSFAFHLAKEYDLGLKWSNDAMNTFDQSAKTSILECFNKRNKVENANHDDVQKYISAFRIRLTGARVGEVLIGYGLSGGTQMEVKGCNIPPILQDVLLVRSFDDLWDGFLTKLGTDIAFFQNMPDNESRGYWILDNAEPEELLHMMDMERLEFKVLSLGKNDNIEKLSEFERTNVMMRNSISAVEFSSLFPTKVGSQTLGGHHTLFFGRSYWKVLTQDPKLEEVDGDTNVIQVSRFSEASVFKGPCKRNDGETLVKVLFCDDVNESVSCLYNEYGADLHLLKLTSHFGVDKEIVDNWVYATRNFTAAAYKSLLQKIIRFRPEKISITTSAKTTSLIFAKDALVVTFIQLLTNPGSFVPDIQRYVTGLESALKRLAIIAFEDSIPDPRLVSELLAGTFISQRYKLWKPAMEQLERWVKFLFQLHDEPRCIVYDLTNGSKCKRVTLSQCCIESQDIEVRHLKTASALLEIVRSFEGDLNMVRDISYTPKKKWKLKSIGSKPTGVMPLHHCVDQHWAPDMVYLFRPVEWLYEECKKAKNQKVSAPFAGILGRLFNEVTGINPRRIGDRFSNDGFESEEFVGHARKAQRSYLNGIQLSSNERERLIEVIDEDGVPVKEDIQVELEDAWLSGMLGTMEVCKGKMLAALVPDNISRVIVAKRPAVRKALKATSRTVEVTGLTAENATAAAGITEDAAAIAGEAEFWKRLQEEGGIPLSAIPTPPLSKFHKSKLSHNGQDFWLHFLSGEKTLWDEAKCDNISIGVLEPLPGIGLSEIEGKSSTEREFPKFDFIDAFMRKDGNGVLKGAEELLLDYGKIYLERFPRAIRRAISYLQRNTPQIEVNRVGRDGGGSEAAVVLDDIGAFNLLVLISCFYPGVLGRANGRVSKFVVKCAPKLWEIRKILQQLMVNDAMGDDDAAGNVAKDWGVLEDKKRKMLGYQEELTTELIESNRKGSRGSFLWLPPGSGKTKIICEYMSRLSAMGRLPPYVVYCLPKESMETIADELRIYGFRFRILSAFPASAKRYADDMSASSGKRTKKTKLKKKEENNLVSDFIVDFPSNTKTAIKSVLEVNGGHEIPSGLKDRFWIHLVEHDHLRMLVAENLLPTSGETLFIIDEVHLAMSDNTQRTASAQAMADASRDFVALTGTPIIDSNLYRLISWLRYLVPFTVTEKNLWSAATNMVARKIEATGIPREYELADAEFTSTEQEQWKSLMPARLGGANRMAGQREFSQAAELSYDAATREMVRQTGKLLSEGGRRGVMLVARNATHAQYLFEEVKRLKIVDKSKVLLFTGVTAAVGGSKSNIVTSLNLTPTNNKKDVKIVIVPYRRATGYTLTALDTLVWTVYPSNQALRTQLEARIDRVGQTSKTLLYVKVVTPLFRLIAERHAAAKTLEDALKALVKEVPANDF
ncbi:hypothetical protein HK098_000960 [Nowakowskiella sp. JEL0407]|nr:hypothetical protein HK098_000960 [Nowakowskiella sp. JEL0407]